MDKMINAMIEELYNDFVEKGDYLDLPETKEASGKVYDIYWDNPNFEDVRRNLENAISNNAIMYEKQGFIYGFKKAMELFEREGGIR